MSRSGLILAVDDDPINIEVIREILDGHFPLITARTGDEALAMVLEHQPDVILLDIMMPGIDGFETTRRLRAMPALSGTKIILVSALAMTRERLAGYEAGADDYVSKPFNTEELLAKVSVFMRMRSIEELNGLKSQLLQLVAHEIRTPLTGIIPAAQLLMEDAEMDVPQRQMWGEMILQNGRRLLALAERGLLLCRLRIEKVDLQFAVTDLAAMVRDCVETAGLGMDRARIDLSIEGEPRVEIDVEHMSHAIGGIVEYALRAAEYGSVEIAVREQDDFVELAVGMPVGTRVPQDTVFESFAECQSGSEVVGSDIGMALARIVLRSHGGEVSVVEDRAAGPSVIGTIPCRRLALADETPGQDNQL